MVISQGDTCITMLLTFEIFGRARNHGKKFLKLCQTSFSGIVHNGRVVVKNTIDAVQICKALFKSHFL